MTRRSDLIESIWGGMDPLVSSLVPVPDYQGWASDHEYLIRAINETRPAVVVEIGVWKGGSVITMADRIKQLGLDAVVVAVDTWLGAWDHWLQPQWFSSLKIQDGYPTLFHTFASNIILKGLQEYVVPIPLDSLNAVKVLQARGVTVDLLHIDGGHDYPAVMADLTAWWPLLREGGVLLGDDYHSEGDVWPEVRQAFQAFFGTDQIEATGGKCYIQK